MIEFKYKLARFLLMLSSRTWRFEIIGNEPGRASIIVFWHGLMLPVWKYFSKFSPYAVVSLSRDGEYLSKILIQWNYKLIRGSSNKGGKEVLNEITALGNKHFILITPDGPMGPIHTFKPGAIISAHRNRMPLVLCGVEIKSKIVFKSWDKFELPLPFSKIILRLSEPILIKDDASREELNSFIIDCEQRLRNQLQ